MPETANAEKAQVKDADLGWYLQQLTLSAFINAFLSIRYKRKIIKWKLFPRQRDFCQEMDRVWNIPEEWLWLLKNRQIGVSFMVAAFLILKCMAYKDYRCLVLSKTGKDAIKFVHFKIKFLLENLYKFAPEIPWPKCRITQELCEFDNGSTIEVMNCADHASRGDMYDIVFLDEGGFGNFEHILEEVLQSVLGTIEHSAGMLITVSTSKPGTPYNARTKLYFEEGADAGISFYVLARDAFPSRLTDEDWKAKVIAKIGEIAFQQEYFEVAEDAFLTKEGYVFKNFERPAGRHIRRIKLSWKWQYWLCYDHGRTRDHPAMLWHLLYNARHDHVHVFYEQFWESEGLDKICQDINSQQIEFRRDLRSPKPQRCLADTAITADDAGSKKRQTIRDIIFQDTKLYFTGVIKHNEKLSLDWMIKRVNENKITFDPACVHSIRQISNILWATEKKSRTRVTEHKARYGVAVDLDNEAIDLGRYICAEIVVRLPSKEEKNEPLPAYSKKAREYREQHSAIKPGKPYHPSHDFMAV